MTVTIDRFAGEHAFLSNFYGCVVEVDGLTFPTAEHAFQAMKSNDIYVRRNIQRAPTAAEAKKRGQLIVLDQKIWERDRDFAMRKVLRAKFRIKELREMLLATGDAILIEGNTWGDTYWGKCRGKGQNVLGRLLMEVRKEISGQG